VLEAQLARLEGGEGARALCFASGLAAITAVTRLLSAGEEILAGDDLYGGTFRLFSRILGRRGIGVRYADPTDPESLCSQIGPRTRLIYVESPTNPLLEIADIGAIAEQAHRKGALVCVDGTVMTPYLQRPLELGADIVVHSATKALCGHSDVTAGVVAVRDARLADELYLIQNGEGAVLGPMDSFLLLRGLKTLAIRLDRAQENTRRIALFLARHPAIGRVHFPGQPDHPGRAVHERQARGPGQVVGFRAGSAEAARIIAESTKLFAITVSFGGVNSSICLPRRMSHASIPPGARPREAVPEDLVRISVGIEDADDLIRDLDESIARASAMGHVLGGRRCATEELPV
jgi:cystathionine beta-lyase